MKPYFAILNVRVYTDECIKRRHSQLTAKIIEAIIRLETVKDRREVTVIHT